MAVSFVLNGEPVQVAEVDPHVTLLAWLRASGRTGSKEGCAEGECGACAVAILRPAAGGRARFEAVNGCLLPLPAVHGRSVVTVEGVAGVGGGAGGGGGADAGGVTSAEAAGAPRLHPVQQAMVQHGGSQCGYCTPGFVVSLFCEYYRPGRAAHSCDPEAIAGNLCRCTGYRPILDAARALPAPADTPDGGTGDPHLAALRVAPPPPGALDHRGGGRRFVRPADLGALLAVLAGDPGAVPIAGGTDLMVYANQRHQRFATLVSLEAVPELRRFEVNAAEVVLGAGLPLSDLEDRLRAQHAGLVPLLEQLWPLFSSRLIRNRATLGGNLATASPIGDAAPALLALDAQLTIAGAATATRRLPLADLFTGYRRTALAPGEVIVSVHLPRPLPAIQRFYKVSKRPLDDISTVAAAFALDLDADGRVARLRAGYGGVAATPLRAHAVEARAAGKPWTRATLEELLDAAATVGTPIDDHRGSAAYRRAMVGTLLERFFAETAPA
jgi:xanthine dehydrogenase small subunit